MNGKEFNIFVKDRQNKISSYMSHVDDVLISIAKEAQKIYDAEGLEGFGDLYRPEYYGVCSIDVNLPGYDGEGFYFFPQGLTDYEG